MKRHRYTACLLLACCAGLAILASGCNKPSQPAVPPKGIVNPTNAVVVINDTVITEAEVSKQLDNIFGATARMTSVPADRLDQLREQLRQQIVDNMVVKTLLSQAIQKAGITVSNEEVTASLDKLKEALPPGEKLDKYLAQMNMTHEDLKNAVTLDLKVEKLFKQKLESIPEPTDSEVAAYYEQNKERYLMPERVTACHILVKTGTNDVGQVKADKKAKAEATRQRLLKGEDFATVAMEVSDCPSKERGGNLGTFGKGQMVKSFEEAAFALPTNTVSELVVSDYGYHLIVVSEHLPEHQMTLDEAKDRIKKLLLAQKQQKAIADYINTLKAQSTITYTGKSK